MYIYHPSLSLVSCPSHHFTNHTDLMHEIEGAAITMKSLMRFSWKYKCAACWHQVARIEGEF